MQFDRREAEAKEDAPSNLAVIGRYVFTPEIFDALDRIEPGAGGELQLTDAIGLLNETQTVYGRVFTDGRYDIGQKIDFLRANVELALDRDDLGPELEKYPRRDRAAPRPRLELRASPVASAVRRRRYRRSVIQLAEVQAEILGVGDRARAGVDAARRRARARCWPSPSSRDEPVPPFANTAMDGYALRAADTAGRDRGDAGAAHGRRRAPGRARADGRRSGRARRSGS